ncbi:hypothetical protein AMTR_s01618p00010000 [Amborella trichopoda]|uniref:Uncharacterized protein n=1 Tax=Amborella trichopoda TaxID=13333 RepID=W1NQ56_AMBTC|nr:hypothetical protein AMTR_s01618p00010000 [Amborella trichopoda]
MRRKRKRFSLELCSLEIMPEPVVEVELAAQPFEVAAVSMDSLVASAYVVLVGKVGLILFQEHPKIPIV